MNTYFKLLAAVAAVVIVAVLGYNLLPGSSTGGSGPRVTPSPSPTPTSSPMALPSPPAVLAAGRYAYSASDPPFTFTVPVGWTLNEEDTVRRTDGPIDDIVNVLHGMRIAAKDAACTEAPAPGIDHTAAALVADMAANPALAASAPRSISIGGLNGQMIDVAIAAGWTRPCPFTDGKPGVTLITDVDLATGPFWGLTDHNKIRIIALDTGGGENVVITVDSADGKTFDSTVAAAMPVIESFVFKP